MILKIDNPKRLLPKRKHIKLVSVKIDGEQVPIEDIIEDDEVATEDGHGIIEL